MLTLQSRLSITLFIISLSLISLTRTRIANLPVGPGELLLLLWDLGAILNLSLIHKVRLSKTAKHIVFFLLLLMLALLVSMLVNVNGIYFYKCKYWHFAIAIFFTLLSNILFFILHGSTVEVFFAVRRFLFLLLSLWGLVYIASKISLLPIDYLWYSSRFTAGAKNPNQAALYLVAIPFLGFWIFNISSDKFTRLLCGIIIISCIALGFLTQSDALYVAWSVSGSLIFLLYFFKKYFTIKSLNSLIVFFLILILIMVAIGFNWSSLFSLFQKIISRYLEGDSGNSFMGTNVRFLLWYNALLVILESPITGFGPGSFSGKESPFLCAEAHNSILDWGMSTGLLGIIFYLLVQFYFFKKVFIKKQYWLLGAIVSLFVLSCFHFIFRHPIFWFLQASITILADGMSSRNFNYIGNKG